MKLWLLRPLDEDIPPWRPWANKMFGVIIRAPSMEKAREMAAKVSGEEGEKAWRDGALSSCVPLEIVGPLCVVMRDFAASAME